MNRVCEYLIHISRRREQLTGGAMCLTRIYATMVKQIKADNTVDWHAIPLARAKWRGLVVLRAGVATGWPETRTITIIANDVTIGACVRPAGR